MIKFLVFIGALFVLSLVSPIGKTIQDAITQNYTYASFSTNLSAIGWFDAYMRSWWWILPIIVFVILVVQFMKKDEPQPFFPPVMQQPRMPRQPKQKAQQQQPKPPIFFGR
jgi:hypothetical protein